jgi:signal transduction histidine kinase
VTPEALRDLFLFAGLDDDQLAWLADHTDEVDVPAGQTACVEGEPARCFYVLLSGTLAMSRRVGANDVEINRTDQRGAYTGAVRFYLPQPEERYSATVRAVTDCRFLALPADEFAEAFREWFPMAVHLLAGQYAGSRNTQVRIGQRERLLALGTLTAGLTHELNNPAAAAVRATGTLRDKVAGMRHKLAMLASGKISGDQLKHLVELQEQFVARVAKAPELTAMQTSDREDEMSDWLDDHGVPGGWDMAPVLVSGGVTVEDLDLVAADTETLEPALRWLAYTVETETLMNEIQQAVERISGLVGSAKQYSQLDRAEQRWIDVHEGLDSTLVMMAGKLGDDIRVLKEYDRDLPQVLAYPGELNQVWTNLIDNAIDAMAGAGTLTVRTARDGDFVLVEIGDTGPGVPKDLWERVFEPFFTTKPIGQGTGLGLDVSWRIIVNRHAGDLRVVSHPGDTRFQARLPIEAPAS